jgi:hypothetical protein
MVDHFQVEQNVATLVGTFLVNEISICFTGRYWALQHEDVVRGRDELIRRLERGLEFPKVVRSSRITDIPAIVQIIPLRAL